MKKAVRTMKLYYWSNYFWIEHFKSIHINFFLELQFHLKTRHHYNSHRKIDQNSNGFNVHFITCIQRRLTQKQSLLHWINPAPEYDKICWKGMHTRQAVGYYLRMLRFLNSSLHWMISFWFSEITSKISLDWTYNQPEILKIC